MLRAADRCSTLYDMEALGVLYSCLERTKEIYIPPLTPYVIICFVKIASISRHIELNVTEYYHDEVSGGKAEADLRRNTD
jgi:hypothetical protein